MKTTLLFILLSLFAFDSQAQTRRVPVPRIAGKDSSASRQTSSTTRPQALSQSLPIRRVILYSNGVSYIERRGVIGMYRTSALPAGRYSLTTTAPGFSKSVVSNLNVNGGIRSHFKVSLNVGRMMETVNVTSSAESTDRNSNDLAINGRNFSVLANLSAGVTTKSSATLGNYIARKESGVQAEASGNEVGDLFEYRIDQPVTVPRDRSALIPILQTRMDGERVSIFNEQSQAHRPMSGLQLRIVYLEYPFDDDEDWKLADNMPKPESKTATYYRFRVDLGPHQKLEFPIVERQEHMETYALTDFTRTELELFIVRKYIDQQTRSALERIIDLKTKVAATDARLLEINKEAAEIAQDQQRLRDNIKALTLTAEAKQLITRYVSKANDQETRLEQIEKERRAAVEEGARLRAELEAAIRDLSFDRNLD